MEEKITKIGKHSLCLKDDKITITGVGKVKNVNENNFVCALESGSLQITGTGIHIINLNVSVGEVELEGRVQGVKYSHTGVKQGLIKRIFG